MCQKEIMDILLKNPRKYYSSLKLSRKLGIDMKQVSRSMSKLIKWEFVLQKFIYKEERYCIRLIKFKNGKRKV